MYFLLGELLEDLDELFQIVCEVHMSNVSFFPLQNNWNFPGDHALNETDVSLDTELSVMTLVCSHTYDASYWNSTWNKCSLVKTHEGQCSVNVTLAVYKFLMNCRL